jgi:type II secretory pathway component PulK
MKTLRNQKGVAMMMAIGTMLVLGILAAELVYQTEVYNSTVFHQRDELRARLMARSGLRLAVLQITAAEKAREKIKSMNLGADSLADQIWQTPLILPPPPLPGLGVAETDALETFKKSLAFDGSLSTSISGESDRLNLNQLVWVSKEQAQKAATGGATDGKGTVVGGTTPALSPEKKKELLESVKKGFVDVVDQMLQQKRQTDDDFRDRYAIVTAETLIGNLVAWMDPETKLDGDNRDKEDYYSRVEPYPYAIKNAPLASESELVSVKGFDDTLAQLFSDNFTIQSTNGLNVNKAPVSLIRALIPELSEEDAEKISKRRNDITLGGPFSNADDFWKFIEPMVRLEEVKKRFEERGLKILESESSYRVIVTAKSGGATKTWVARVGPGAPEVQQENQQPGATKPPAGLEGPLEDAVKAAENKTDSAKNSSKTPNIIYLKAD